MVHRLCVKTVPSPRPNWLQTIPVRVAPSRIAIEGMYLCEKGSKGTILQAESLGFFLRSKSFMFLFKES